MFIYSSPYTTVTCELFNIIYWSACGPLCPTSQWPSVPHLPVALCAPPPCGSMCLHPLWPSVPLPLPLWPTAPLWGHLYWINDRFACSAVKQSFAHQTSIHYELCHNMFSNYKLKSKILSNHCSDKMSNGPELY